MKTVLMAIVLLGSACGGSQDVVLGDDWPETAPDYDDAYERWTRRDRAYNGVDLVVDAYATLKSPEWRVAYAAAKARQAKMTPGARAALFDQEHQAMREFWEVELVVATHDYAVMDFSSNTTSMWRMTLIGDGGREVTPTSVRVDNRSRVEIGAWFPSMTPFHRAYVMKFPKLAADGQPLVTADSPRLELRLGSALATVNLVWER
jgi:hypothetical protein